MASRLGELRPDCLKDWHVLNIDPMGNNVLFILGAPRSGTTWLGKIFDSHPRVVYRHEPDTVLRCNMIPVLCRTADIPAFTPRAREYLLDLLNVRGLKSAGSLPLFPKKYRDAHSEALRAAMVYGGKIAGAFLGARCSSSITIPDYWSRGEPVSATFVMKSVSARGRIRLFAEALPASRIIFILRHPCGQVASMLNSISNGFFEDEVPFAEILETEEAAQFGLTASVFAKLDLVEKCAWHWVILNQKAINDLPDAPRTTRVRYSELCSALQQTVMNLFCFAGLDWPVQSERFLHRSMPATSRGYRIARQWLASIDRWRSTLPVEQQQRILSIVRQVPIGQGYGE